MYKDFKKSESLDTGFVAGSGILWMISGIVLGLLVGIGVYSFSNEKSSLYSNNDSVLKQIEKIQSATTSPVHAQKQSLANDKKISKVMVKEKSKLRENKFNYYAVLPTVNVPVELAVPIETREEYLVQNKGRSSKTNLPNANLATSSVEKQAKRRSETLKTASKKKAVRGDYLLRVASFKKESRANITRGRLSKKGVDAYIQKKKIKGRYWYRVVAGPVSQRNVYNWKKTAERLGHRPMVISVR